MSDPASRWGGAGRWGPPEPTEHHRAIEDLTVAVRRLVEATVATGHDGPVVRDLTEQVHAIAEKLESKLDDDPWRSRSYGPGAGDAGAMMAISPAIGRSNPTAPVVRLAVDPDGQHLSGTVRFGLAHMGPPDRAHGGSVALVLDQVLGIMAIAAGAPGMTAYLTVTYRRGTPIDEDVRIEAAFVEADGRRSRTTARLLDAAGKVTAEAEATFMKPRAAPPSSERC